VTGEFVLDKAEIVFTESFASLNLREREANIAAIKEKYTAQISDEMPYGQNEKGKTNY